MNYQQFVEKIRENVKRNLEPNLTIELITTLKNNSHERVGLIISDSQINISPTIYLEEYYEHYLEDFSMDYIVENIIELYHEIKYEQDLDIECIKDVENIQPLIAYKLINIEKNQALLSKLPHIPYFDLAITFYVLFETEPMGTATIPITYDLLRLWQMDLDTLHEIAHYNMPLLLPASFKPMYLAIADLLKDLPLEYTSEHNPLYVLTNATRCFGASCILYDDMLEQIGEELGENYYLLPSSIHEMIIVPESKSPNRSDLNEMIQEINLTQVNPEEILSDHAYFYDRTLQYIY